VLGNIHVQLITDLDSEGLRNDMIQHNDLKFSWDRNSANIPEAKIGLVVLHAPLRNKGIGTLIWNKVYEHLPGPLRNELVINGTLHTYDSDPLRDHYWKKIIGYGKLPGAKFQLYPDKPGYFRGRLCQENLVISPKLIVNTISLDTYNQRLKSKSNSSFPVY